MPEPDIEAIEAALAEATPGPWHVIDTDDGAAISGQNHEWVADLGFGHDDDNPRPRDAQLIVQAPTWLRQLLDALGDARYDAAETHREVAAVREDLGDSECELKAALRSIADSERDRVVIGDLSDNLRAADAALTRVRTLAEEWARGDEDLPRAFADIEVRFGRRLLAAIAGDDETEKAPDPIPDMPGEPTLGTCDIWLTAPEPHVVTIVCRNWRPLTSPEEGS